MKTPRKRCSAGADPGGPRAANNGRRTMSATSGTVAATAEQNKAKPQPGAVDVSKMPAEVAVQRLIDHAVGMGSSDLFMVSDNGSVSVMVRHLGIIATIATLTPEQGRRALSHIKASAGKDPNGKGRPPCGRWVYPRGKNGRPHHTGRNRPKQNPPGGREELP